LKRTQRAVTDPGQSVEKAGSSSAGTERSLLLMAHFIEWSRLPMKELIDVRWAAAQSGQSSRSVRGLRTRSAFRRLGPSAVARRVAALFPAKEDNHPRILGRTDHGRRQIFGREGVIADQEVA
jgi:hypothetical protein